jgi:hypothetical protein
MIDEFSRLDGDPAVGWALPQGGVYYVPLQFLIFSVKLLPRAAGEEMGNCCVRCQYRFNSPPPPSA